MLSLGIFSKENKTENGLEEVNYEDMYEKIKTIRDFFDFEFARKGDKNDAINKVYIKYSNTSVFRMEGLLDVKIEKIRLNDEKDIEVEFKIESCELIDCFFPGYFRKISAGWNFNVESANLNVVEIQALVQKRIDLINDIFEFLDYPRTNAKEIQFSSKTRGKEYDMEYDGMKALRNAKGENSYFIRTLGFKHDLKLMRQLPLENLKSGDSKNKRKQMNAYRDILLQYLDGFTVQKEVDSRMCCYHATLGDCKFDILLTRDGSYNYLPSGIFVRFYDMKFAETEKIYKALVEHVNMMNTILKERTRVAKLVKTVKKGLLDNLIKFDNFKWRELTLQKLENMLVWYRGLVDLGDDKYAPIAVDYIEDFYKQVKGRKEEHQISSFKAKIEDEKYLIPLQKEDMEALAEHRKKEFIIGLSLRSDKEGFVDEQLEKLAKIPQELWFNAFEGAGAAMYLNDSFIPRFLEVLDSKYHDKFVNFFYESMIMADLQQLGGDSIGDLVNVEDKSKYAAKDFKVDIERYENMLDYPIFHAVKLKYAELFYRLVRNQLKKNLDLVMIAPGDLLEKIDMQKYIWNTFKGNASDFSYMQIWIYERAYDDILDNHRGKPVLDFNLFRNLQEKNWDRFVRQLLLPTMVYKMDTLLEEEQQEVLEMITQNDFCNAFCKLYEDVPEWVLELSRKNKEHHIDYCNKVMEKWYLSRNLKLDIMDINQEQVKKLLEKRLDMDYLHLGSGLLDLGVKIGAVLTEFKEDNTSIPRDLAMQIMYVTSLYDEFFAKREKFDDEYCIRHLITKDSNMIYNFISRDLSENVAKNIFKYIAKHIKEIKDKSILESDFMQNYLIKWGTLQDISYINEYVDLTIDVTRGVYARASMEEKEEYFEKYLGAYDSMQIAYSEEEDEDFLLKVIDRWQMSAKEAQINLAKHNSQRVKGHLLYSAKELHPEAIDILLETANDAVKERMLEKHSSNIYIRMNSLENISDADMIIMLNETKLSDREKEQIVEYGGEMVHLHVISNMIMKDNMKAHIAEKGTDRAKIEMIREVMIPDGIKKILAETSGDNVMLEMIDEMIVSDEVKEIMVMKGGDEVKVSMIYNFTLSDKIKEILARESGDNVRLEMVKELTLSEKVKEIIAIQGRDEVKLAMIDNLTLPEKVKEILARQGGKRVLISMIENITLPERIKEIIATKADAEVARFMKENLILNDKIRRMIGN